MNYSNLTVKEIQNIIRERTANINAYFSDKDELTFAESEVKNKLINIAGKGKGDKIGLHFNTKTKKGLEYQARELEYALRLTEEGDNFIAEKYSKMFLDFKKDHPDMSEEDWKDIVTAFGTVGKDIVQQFDSNQIADLYVNSDKKVNLAQLMLDIVKDKKGTGASIRDMTDELELRLIDKL